MKRLYDTQWHNIPFSSFSKLSYFNLPDRSFYEKFYDVFFSKYADYEVLSSELRMKKELQGAHIVETIKQLPAHSNILSFGCGMGYLEYKMLPLIHARSLNLYCYETSEVQFSFLRKYLGSSYCLSGVIQKSIPKDVKFDLCYLLAVDYALTNHQLIDLLRILKKFLNQNGMLMVSSITVEEYKINNDFYFKKLYKIWKEKINYIFRDPDMQFWGWYRTIDELLRICLESGLRVKEYGSFEDIKNMYIKCK